LPALVLEVERPLFVGRPTRVDDEVDVVGRLVHPHRHVGARRSQTRHDRVGDPAQERPQLGGLGFREQPEILAVLFGLDDDGANAERAEAVLATPAGRLRDQAAGDVDAAATRITRKAALYGALVPSRPY
jgi:hypothetical protein